MFGPGSHRSKSCPHVVTLRLCTVFIYTKFTNPLPAIHPVNQHKAMDSAKGHLFKAKYKTRKENKVRCLISCCCYLKLTALRLSMRTPAGGSESEATVTWSSWTHTATVAALHTAAPAPAHSSTDSRSPHPCCCSYSQGQQQRRGVSSAV